MRASGPTGPSTPARHPRKERAMNQSVTEHFPRPFSILFGFFESSSPRPHGDRSFVCRWRTARDQSCCITFRWRRRGLSGVGASRTGRDVIKAALATPDQPRPGWAVNTETWASNCDCGATWASKTSETAAGVLYLRGPRQGTASVKQNDEPRAPGAQGSMKSTIWGERQSI